MVTILNHGGLSICYDDILRLRTRLALYTKYMSDNDCILPLHFNPDSFVTAALDNLDFKDSGM